MSDGPLIIDVSPRDGLQNDPVILEPDVRAELCRRLVATGIQRVEAVSFVHPSYVPAMAGAEEVVAALPDLRDETLVGLALLLKGRRDLRSRNLVPQRTLRTLRDDAEWAKEQMR